MPVTIKRSQLMYKNESTGEYVSVDAVADKTSQQQINGINTAASNAIASINTAMQDIDTQPLTTLPKKAYKKDLVTNEETLASAATHAYAVGDYFYVADNNNDISLYKATAAIAVGNTISPGTGVDNNCIPAALADDVTSLSNDLDNVKADLSDKTGYISENIFYYHSNPYYTQGQYYLKTGEIAASSSWSTFTPDISEYDEIEYSGLSSAGGSSVVSCWFDSNMGFIGYFKQAVGTNRISVPEGAQYIGFSLNRTQSVLDVFTMRGIVTGSINESLDNLTEYIMEIKSTNILDKSQVIMEQYYTKTGAISTSNSWASCKIDIEGYRAIEYEGLSAVGGANVVDCWFDSNDTLIAYFAPKTGTQIEEVPENAKYIGLSISRANEGVNAFALYGIKGGTVTKKLSDLEESFDNLSGVVGAKSENLYNLENIQRRTYYTTDGSILDSTSFATIKLDIEGYHSIVYDGITKIGGNTVVCCWFDANDEFLGYFKQNTGVNVEDVLPNAKYVGMSIGNGSDPNTFVLYGLTGTISDISMLEDRADKEELRMDKLNLMVGAFQNAYTYDYQIGRPGNQDVSWTWWTRPLCVYFKGVRERVYYGFTSQSGFSGVAMYDLNNKQFKKTYLLKGTVDDHNASAVIVQPDRHILAAYPSGHNYSNSMFVRRSKYPEDINEWNDPIELVSSVGEVSYAQILYIANKYWLFYRCTYLMPGKTAKEPSRWCYRVSNDAITWSDERSLIISNNEQYYTLVAPTSNPARLRFCLAASPKYPDACIRMGFIDTSDETIYNADNSTVIRNGADDLTVPISDSLFTVIINGAWPTRIRLFDVKRYTAPEDVRILYTLFATSDDSSSEYYIYNNGTNMKLCDGGKSLLNPGYQLGAAFVGDDIVLIRDANDIDYVEIVGYDGALKKSVYSEAIGIIPIRNARPVPDDSGKAIIWQRGYYNSDNYKDFDMDSVLLINDQVVF